ncbi:MAG: alcohol dehydrogenase catalytic domain-containing protein, partial [Pseudomonadota bacterium]
MKALVYEGVEDLAVRERADPVAPAGEQLIRVEAVGICGSDMHAYLGHDARRPAPLILGHEAAGTIVGGAMDGRRVTVNPLVTCGVCPACRFGRENICPDRQIISMPPREGAFAQYITVPDSNLVTVPNEISFETAALAEPLAVSWHAARLALNALHPADEKRALVIGGGAIGLAAALCLKAMGCQEVVISEPNDARRAHLEDA